MKKSVVLSVLALVAVVVAVVVGGRVDRTGGGAASATADEAPVLVVGSTSAPENALLGEIYAGALRAAGVQVSTALHPRSREELFSALESGDVAVVPEYTGALLAYLDPDADAAAGTEEQVTQLREVLPRELRLLNASAAQDQDTVTCRSEVVERHALASLADLGPVKGLVMGGPPELAHGADGLSLSGLQSAYGIEFAEFTPLDLAVPLTVAALQEEVDCAQADSLSRGGRPCPAGSKRATAAGSSCSPATPGTCWWWRRPIRWVIPTCSGGPPLSSVSRLTQRRPQRQTT